jgi:hypothetical protein
MGKPAGLRARVLHRTVTGGWGDTRGNTHAVAYSPASGLLSSAAFAISLLLSLLELWLVVLSDSSSSLRAAKITEVGFGAMLGCLVCCGRVSAGAGKVLMDFLGANKTESGGEQEITHKLD